MAAQRRRHLRRDCASCGHDISMHAYSPSNPLNYGPGKCTARGCSCARFVRTAKGARKHKHPPRASGKCRICGV